MSEKFLTSGQVAKMLRVSEGTLRNWAKNGKLKPHHIADNGYKFYLKQKIQKLANSFRMPVKSTHIDSNIVIIPATLDVENVKIKSDISDFKPYVDKSTGQAIEPYNSMRNGAIMPLYTSLINLNIYL